VIALSQTRREQEKEKKRGDRRARPRPVEAGKKERKTATSPTRGEKVSTSWS